MREVKIRGRKLKVLEYADEVLEVMGQVWEIKKKKI